MFNNKENNQNIQKDKKNKILTKKNIEKNGNVIYNT